MNSTSTPALNCFFCVLSLQEPDDAEELATQVLKQKPDCYEAYYARAKSRVDLRLVKCLINISNSILFFEALVFLYCIYLFFCTKYK